MYGSKVAITGMIIQGYGAVYNMEGFGAKGRGMRGWLFTEVQRRQYTL